MSHDPLFDSEQNRALLAFCARRQIRNNGIGGIAWGAINIIIGIGGTDAPAIRMGMAVLGAAMLLVGIWVLRRPTRRALFVEMVVSITLSAWLMRSEIDSHQGLDEMDLRVAALPLFVAIAFIGNYRGLQRVDGRVFSIDAQRIRKAEEICKAVMEEELEDDHSVVESTMRQCRAQLLDGRAFFIQRNLTRAFVATRDAVRAALASPDANRCKLVFNHPLGRLVYRFNSRQTGKIKAWLAQSCQVEDTPGASDLPGQP
ncbi:hypothetical protein GX586_13790 [bacterium]|nr:hypothetical protein [bacterium]